jgi:hypothetical protein
MSLTTRAVFLYAVIASFLAVLTWAAIASGLTDTLNESQGRRYRLVVVLLSLIGLVHPAFALVAWDVNRQLQMATEAVSPSSSRANLVVVVSLGVTAVGAGALLSG